MKKLLTAAALLTAFSADAALININAGSTPAGFEPATMTYTGVSSLGFNILNATSRYFQNPVNTGNTVKAGDIFNDIGKTMLTIVGGTGTACEISSVSISSECHNFTYSLQASYNFYGVVLPLGADLVGAISGGFIDIQVSKTKSGANFTNYSTVASVAVTGSAPSEPGTTSAGISIYGVVDYSGLNTSNSLIKDFFEFSTPKVVNSVYSKNWVDLWQSGVAANPQQYINAVTIATLSNANNTALTKIQDLTYDSQTSTFSFNGSPFQNQMFAGMPFSILNDTSMRSTTRSGESLNGSIVFNVVPEPATLAIFGAGLLGLGFVGRRRNKNTK